MTRTQRFGLSMISVPITCGALLGPVCARPGAEAGPHHAGWTKVGFMYTDHPPPIDAWIVPLLTRYGPRHAENGLPGTPVIYAVLDAAIPGSRIIVALGASDEGCVSAPQGRNATLAPDACPTHILIVDHSGHVHAIRQAKGCFVWIEPDDPSIDPYANAVYFRFVSRTRSIETRTLIGGRAVPGCAVSVPLD